MFHGEAEGTQTRQGEIRAAAAAALASASGAVGGRLELELRGAKAIRAFDGWIIVVSVKARSKEKEEVTRLMGAFPCPDDDTPRGAVMAALDAINRLMEKYLAESDGGHPSL